MKVLLSELFKINYTAITDDRISNECNYALLEIVNAFERCVYQGICIVDFSINALLHISNNIADIFGVSKSGEHEGLYIQDISEGELASFREVLEKAIVFMNNLPLCNRNNYTLLCNLNIRLRKISRSVSIKMTPLFTNGSGLISIVLFVFSIPIRHERSYAIIKKYGDLSSYFCLRSGKWIRCEEDPLSDAEREVIVLSAQGFTMAEIAEKLCKSIDTVKGYKRTIFKKLSIKNISEAITCVLNSKKI